MVDTYGAHESRIYYVEEATYGQTPSNPAMLGIPAENIDPAIDPANIKVRGVGNIDLQTIRKGLRNVSLKVTYPLPRDVPTGLLGYAKAELNKSLSIQVLYYKGIFASATDIISLLYTGCKFNKVTVECSIEDIVKATAEMIGQDLTVGTSKIAGATYTDYADAVPFYESYVKKGTTTLDRVTDWKFTIENNLKAVPVIRPTSGHLLKYLPYRHRNLTGEITFEFESKEEFDDVINDASFDLEFGLGGIKKAVFSSCEWENVAAPTRIENLVACKASFVAKGPVSIS
jgi:hypothetical protein